MHTWNGWGSVTHWNAFVAVLEMGGKGTFYAPRLNDDSKFSVAAIAGFDTDIRLIDSQCTRVMLVGECGCKR